MVREESDDIAGPLRERGVPVEYLVAEDGGHGFADSENQVRLHRAIEQHLAEYLGRK